MAKKNTTTRRLKPGIKHSFRDDNGVRVRVVGPCNIECTPAQEQAFRDLLEPVGTTGAPTPEVKAAPEKEEEKAEKAEAKPAAPTSSPAAAGVKP